MSNTQVFLTTGNHQKVVDTVVKAPPAIAWNAARIQDRNKLASKIVDQKIDLSYYRENKIRNNYIQTNKQYYDYNDKKRNVDSINAIHLNEIHIKSKLENSKPQGNPRTINQKEYSSKLQNNYLESNQSKDNHIKQNHMYISKPLYRLKDSQQQVVRSTNPEMPQWATHTTKYYSKNYKEDLINYKRQLKNLPKCDVMGQVIQKWMTICVLDCPTLPAEVRVDVWSSLSITIVPSDSPVAPITSNQSGKKTLPNKPLIKKSRVKLAKASMSLSNVPAYPLHEKTLMVREKPVQLKIGHGGPEYLKKN